MHPSDSDELDLLKLVKKVRCGCVIDKKPTSMYLQEFLSERYDSEADKLYVSTVF